MTLKLAPTSADELDSSCASIDGTSDATTSSRELLRLPFSCGRKEVYDEDGALVAVLPANDSLANTNISFSGTSTNIKFGPETHFHDAVTVIFPPSNIPKTQNGTLPEIDRVVCEKEVHVISPPADPPVIKPRPGFFRRHFKAIMITLTAATLILAATLIALRLIASKKSKHTPIEPSTTEEPTTITTTDGRQVMPYTFNKSQWGGQVVNNLDPIETPIKYVIIKHTKSKTCTHTTECFVAMQDLQHSDVAEHHFKDIRYNFVIGGDGNIYVGRGWHKRNEQTNDSIDIAYMGDYSVNEPSEFVAYAGNYLIVKGILNDFLSYSNIKVVCHNQTEDTDSPGEYLYRVIIKWDHYSKDVIKSGGYLNESRV